MLNYISFQMADVPLIFVINKINQASRFVLGRVLEYLNSTKAPLVQPCLLAVRSRIVKLRGLQNRQVIRVSPNFWESKIDLRRHFVPGGSIHSL